MDFTISVSIHCFTVKNQVEDALVGLYFKKDSIRAVRLVSVSLICL